MSPHQVNNDQQQEQKQGSSAGGGGISSKAPLGYGGLGGLGKSPKHWLMGDEAFEARMPHHDGVQALWETKWKFPCSKSLYPFHDGLYADFAPSFDALIKANHNDMTSPAWTTTFLSTGVAEQLVEQGDKLVAELNNIKPPGCLQPEQQQQQQQQRRRQLREQASSLYLRACCLYRIARFPYITSFPKVNDQTKWDAWEKQKEIYSKAGQLWEESPVEEVKVAFLDRQTQQGEGQWIPVYVRVPPAGTSSQPSTGSGYPTVILMTGLDGYRPDNTVRCNEFLARGWAVVVVEIPGTADCPADPADPESPDRLWESLLQWMGTYQYRGKRTFDMKRVMVWGLSAGGYYAVRIAHTHSHRLAGVVAQGAGVHYFYDKKWMEKVDGHEYPAQLTPAFAMKHGYSSVDEFKAGVQKKFSLLENGILAKPSTRLLLVNGTQDGLMPIEDSMVLLEYGSPKEARFFTGALHMGYPLANSAVYPWMESVMASIRE
ncbi:pigment biosynthesis protein Ayg1 [Neurospora crassa OR74A]|uniref:Pigment biosynthesis protein Ayg1 n=1 Tax=Neurospora crassa (strain ATCC 24698 / 74-OR23-1A / CBS 708.71 / DSM 1257 / FGSC 987) TaxID=367110 RepID=Q7SHA3_NEUCR|nr:pigment biosynthesis protein Ayg1 [Neurospora crassa OR74A]EAA36298.3 pigment biosynthesis protein Ayg1 [Neurospora crassa OR74A]|eukprot:XP_965534.3 pigment biosynthesis protein Ayg1 [Neurospora crassa OR74A]